MRRETRSFHPVGSPIVELCQVRLAAAVAAGRVPATAASIAQSHLAALQVSVRIGAPSPVEVALQAAVAVAHVTGTLEVLHA